ncbi:S26 family signal peptidase [Kitasatospora acidiphila]|uniref:S26 family signal peptidase n=1 Tax=Kitasatospora acidiphila TaxID=2567942 RepID=UPI003C731D5B
MNALTVAPGLLIGTAGVLGTVGVAGWIARRLLVVVTVRGASMLPVFCDGERVLVLRAKSLTAGQVVVIAAPALRERTAAQPRQLGIRGLRTGALDGRRWVIKRVAALPGDQVPPAARSGPAGSGPVPPGRLVLLGDNPAASLDSRQYGYFPAGQVLGRVVRRLPSPPRGIR